MKNKEIKEEILKISETVTNQMPDKRNFNIPEGYFDELNDKVMAQANQNEDMDIALMYLNDNMYKMETDELIDYQLIQEEDITLIEQEYEYEFLDFDSLEAALEL